MKIKPALYYSHALLKSIINSGDTVIDATVGNGNDTKFLAELVGLSGHVYGFDIQKLAIQNTTKVLIKNNLASQTTLFQTSHEQIRNLIPTDVKIQAAIFNLGYLPGGNHKKITTAPTTLIAIKECLMRLNKNGIVAIVLYYGHLGGMEEKDAVIKFARQLDQKQYTVLNYQFINQANHPPILLAIQKR